MVSGNPAELRNVAMKAKQVAASLEAEFKAIEGQYSALRFDVPNKRKVDDLLVAGRQKSKEAVMQLGEFEKRLSAIAQQLENINKV